MLLYENPLDFWNAQRPHLSKTEKYDIGAHEFGTTGAAHIGLDMTTFPFEVPAFKSAIQSQTETLTDADSRKAEQGWFIDQMLVRAENARGEGVVNGRGID